MIDSNVPVHSVHGTHTNFLLVAGMVPIMMGFPISLSNLYYLLLMPPAIYQCVLVFKNHIIPGIRDFFKKVFNSG